MKYLCADVLLISQTLFIDPALFIDRALFIDPALFIDQTLFIDPALFVDPALFIDRVLIDLLYRCKRFTLVLNLIEVGNLILLFCAITIILNILFGIM